MSLLFLKKLRSPSLAPKSSRALMCNAYSCLVHMPPVSDFLQTVPQPSRLASMCIIASIGSFFKFLVAVIMLFFHQVSSFLERSESVIFASKLPLFC